MAKPFELYKAIKIFVASPGDLELEREAVRNEIEELNQIFRKDKIQFYFIGWEDTPGGHGRAQGHINEQMEECDYFLLLMHERWGSPSGDKYSSGTEEEFHVAEDLLAKGQIKDMLILFKNVEKSKLDDPGEQLKKVLEFRKMLTAGRKFFHKPFKNESDLRKLIRIHLHEWTTSIMKLDYTSDAVSASKTNEAISSENKVDNPNKAFNNAAVVIGAGEVRLTAASIKNYLVNTPLNMLNPFINKLTSDIGKAAGTAMITAPHHHNPPVSMLRELGINTISELDNILKENQRQIVLFTSHWVNRAEKKHNSIHFIDFPLYVLIYWLLSNKSKEYIRNFFEELGIFGFPGPELAVWRLPTDIEQLSARIIQLGELTKADLAAPINPS